jgi:hypothetical protein
LELRLGFLTPSSWHWLLIVLLGISVSDVTGRVAEFVGLIQVVAADDVDIRWNGNCYNYRVATSYLVRLCELQRGHRGDECSKPFNVTLALGFVLPDLGKNEGFESNFQLCLPVRNQRQS